MLTVELFEMRDVERDRAPVLEVAEAEDEVEVIEAAFLTLRDAGEQDGCRQTGATEATLRPRV